MQPGRLHPYSLRLKELLKGGDSLKIYERGVSGERTDSMCARLGEELKSLQNIRITIILGGTNDLNAHLKATHILSNLYEMHEMVYRYGDKINKATYTIAITIPESGWGFDEIVQADVNNGIRSFVSLHSNRTILLDLARLINRKDNISLWAHDKGHFNEEGYDKIADMLYRGMGTIDLVNPSKNGASDGHETWLDLFRRNESILLGIGDSLTHGLYVDEDGEAHGFGAKKWDPHPYGMKIVELLGNNKDSVVMAGINGEETAAMLDRLPHALKHANTNANRRVRVVSILGGTNDCGLFNRKAHDIVTNLEKMYEIVHNYGKEINQPTITVAMTIPECSFTNGTTRELVNIEIREYVSKHKDSMLLVDLARDFNISDNAVTKIWSPDNCHFSMHGYDVIGEKIFKLLQSTSVHLSP